MTDFENTRRMRLDHELDAALGKYTAVEPRAGLEERIIANLKAQPRVATDFSWWRLAGAVVVALLVTVLLVWRLENRRPRQSVSHAVVPQQQAKPQVPPKDKPASNRAIPVPLRHPRKHVSDLEIVAAVEQRTGPKLEQFPAPRPLTAEEKMLLDYVGRYHQEAVVIARAQAEQNRNHGDQEAEKP